MERWVDYYSILQVNQDVGVDALKQSYRKLCRKFHPDLNASPDAVRQMAQINLAYDTLKDEIKRKLYNIEWQSHNRLIINAGFKNTGYKPPKTKPEAARNPNWHKNPGQTDTKYQGDIEKAGLVISKYLNHLINGEFEAAYNLLSSYDKHYISLKEFTHWQSSVAKFYTLKGFVIRNSKLHEDYIIDEYTTCTALRFQMLVTEINKNADTESQYILTKFVVKEQEQYTVYLGYCNLDYIAQQIVNLANISKDASEKLNLMGIPNQQGFLEQCKGEVYRYQRHNRKFVVAALKIMAVKHNQAAEVTEKMAIYTSYIIKKMLRVIDAVAYVDGSCFALMFSETDYKGAKLALERMSRRISQDNLACFDTKIEVHFSLQEFAGIAIEEDLAKCLKDLAGQTKKVVSI